MIMSQFMLLLVLVIVLLPVVVAKLVLDYQSNQDRSAREVTLTVGELERLVRRYVDDATAPLRSRIDELERALDKRGMSSGDSVEDPFPLIDDPSLEDDDLRCDGDGSNRQGDNMA